MTGLGMSPAAALRAATAGAPTLLGLDDRSARSQPASSPTSSPSPATRSTDITATERVSFVMKEGTIVKR